MKNLLLFHLHVETSEREVACDCEVVATRHPTMSEERQNKNGIASFSLTIKMPLCFAVFLFDLFSLVDSHSFLASNTMYICSSFMYVFDIIFLFSQ